MRVTAKCSANKRDGQPCTLPAISENGLCWAHDPQNAEQRRAAASRAAKSKPGVELREVKLKLRTLADDVLAGRVERGAGSVAAQILGVYLRAVEQERKQRELEDLAKRLEELEALLAQREREKQWG